MRRMLSPTAAAAALLLALGCDPQRRVVGPWVLATVDGVGPAAAAPLRVMFPAVAYDGDTLALHGMWHEITLDSLTLELGPGGAWRAHLYEAKRTLARANTFERPDYVSGAFGGDLIREEGQPAPGESAGRWTLAGDTLTLTETYERTVADLAARVHQALPKAAPDSIEAALERAVPASAPPRWTGIVKGERLELVDADGRKLAFRRPGRSR